MMVKYNKGCFRMKIPGTTLILIIYMSPELVGNISVKCYALYPVTSYSNSRKNIAMLFPYS